MTTKRESHQKTAEREETRSRSPSDGVAASRNLLPVCHIDVGGPMYWLPIRGKLRLFEMHPIFGPFTLNARTWEVLDNYPPGFWESFNLWDAGGRRLDGDKCLLPEWCSACNATGDKIEHLGGKHYEIVDVCESCNGTKVIWNQGTTP